MTQNKPSYSIKYIRLCVERIADVKHQVKVVIPPHRRDWITKIKQVPHARFDKALKAWLLPYSKEEFRIFHRLFKGVYSCNFTIEKDIPERFRDYFEHEFPHAKVIIRSDNNDEWFKVFVPKAAEAWRDFVKQIPGRTWNRHEKAWFVPYVKYSFRHLKNTLGNRLSIEMNIKADIPEYFICKPSASEKSAASAAVSIQKTLNAKQKKALTALEEALMLEHKSQRTIKTYKTQLRSLFLYHTNTLPSQITAEQIREYVLHKIKTDNIAERTQGQIINAFAAFYKRLLKQENKLHLLKRPKKPKDLPNVFSVQEIERLLNSIHNLKHKTLLVLVYSSGLRKNEIRNLHKKDVFFDRNTIFVRCSKGKKDRYVILSNIAAKLLQSYIGQYDPKYWLFEGIHGGQYSETSIQRIFVAAKEKSKVNPNITLHGLRHSFATHLVDNNVPLHVVKELLGHQSLETTQVYLHVSDKMRKGIESPLDSLNIRI